MVRRLVIYHNVCIPWLCESDDSFFASTASGIVVLLILCSATGSITLNHWPFGTTVYSLNRFKSLCFPASALIFRPQAVRTSWATKRYTCQQFGQLLWGISGKLRGWEILWTRVYTLVNWHTYGTSLFLTSHFGNHHMNISHMYIK